MTPSRPISIPCTVSRPAALLAGSVLSAALAGCAVNPFTLHYQGERLEAVADARLVTAAPAAGTARELGTSTFLANSDARADDQAVAAAREVGADLVMVTQSGVDPEEWSREDPVYRRRAMGQGNFASYTPLPGQRQGLRFTARFWRSLESGPATR
ncbi:MAG: hypothetical protein ACOYO7_07925 [Phycisphaerales bacterium]|jgi:hypothetical protein